MNRNMKVNLGKTTRAKPVTNSIKLRHALLDLENQISLPDLFSRKVFALDTFFPIADAFQEKYEPEGSTWYSKEQLDIKIR